MGMSLGLAIHQFYEKGTVARDKILVLFLCFLFLLFNVKFFARMTVLKVSYTK